MKFTCYYTVLEDENNNYALGVLFEHEEFHVYGMRKFGGVGSGYYIDSTYLEDINNKWNEYSKLINKSVVKVPRDTDDPILKNHPDIDNAILIPWEFVSEFEMSDAGLFFSKMIYDSLKTVTVEEFEKLKRDCNDERKDF